MHQYTNALQMMSVHQCTSAVQMMPVQCVVRKGLHYRQFSARRSKLRSRCINIRPRPYTVCVTEEVQQSRSRAISVDFDVCVFIKTAHINAVVCRAMHRIKLHWLIVHWLALRIVVVH